MVWVVIADAWNVLEVMLGPTFTDPAVRVDLEFEGGCVTHDATLERA